MKTSSDLPRLLTAVCVALVSTSVATSVSAQNGPDLMRQMMELQLARLVNIDNLLIEQEVMGVSTTLYLVKETVNGQPTLVPRVTISGGDAMPCEGDAPLTGWSGSPEFYVRFADRFVLDATTDFEGRPAYRLAITDFSGINGFTSVNLAGQATQKL